MRLLMVCGTFDNNEGKPSKIGNTIIDSIELDNPNNNHSILINGGHLNELDNIDFMEANCIIWMPNIDNSEDKILPKIKKNNPHAILVSSKRAIEKEYTEWDVVGRLLASRSNLGIMITKNTNNQLNFQLLDPLGNSYYNGEKATKLGEALAERLNFMDSLTRMPSTNINKAKDNIVEKDFIQLVKKTADEFSKHVNANNPNRMLGNASTRCMSGFPAVKDTYGRIFVTRRNIDKKTIAKDGFIECELTNDNQVGYYGEVKPSVDTPIQLLLFKAFPHIKYMIHGHVYVKNAPFTESKIPCGYLEEFEEVVQTIAKNYDLNSSAAINLKGHGCLILAKDLDFFKNIKYYNRPLPEEN